MYRGLRQIAKRMAWKSPMTPLRHHEKYDDPKLCFPMMMLPTGKGLGFVWITSDAQIELWMQRWSLLSANERIARLKRPRKRKVIRIGGTVEPTNWQEKKRRLHEELRWDTLEPGEKAYIKARELTPEELEEIERYDAEKRTETTDQREGEGVQPGPQEASPRPGITNPLAEHSRRVANRHFERRKRSRG